MKPSRIIITLVLFFCAAFANFYAVRKMTQYGLEWYMYDKLLVAYNTGSRQGLDKELEIIFTSDNMPREAILARRFQEKLPAIEDLQTYLKDITAEKKNKVLLFKHLRTATLILLLLILGFRFLINLAARKNKP